MGGYGGGEWSRYQDGLNVGYDSDGNPMGGYIGQDAVAVYDDEGNPKGIKQSTDYDAQGYPIAGGGYEIPWDGTDGGGAFDDEDVAVLALMPPLDGVYGPGMMYLDDEMGGYGRAKPADDAPATVRYRATYDRLGDFAFLRYLDGFYWASKVVDKVRDVDDADWRAELVPSGSEKARGVDAEQDPEKPSVIPWNTLLFASVAIAGIAGVAYTAPSAFATAQLASKHASAFVLETYKVVFKPVASVAKAILPGV
jgi:hypothetical protein